MGTQSFDVYLKMSGSAVSMTDEACTENSGTEFQITTASKRLIDPATSITVEVDASPVASSTYTIDYLQGKITFDSSQTGSTVTISGKYLPVYTVGEATGGSLSTSRGEIAYSQINGRDSYVVKAGKQNVELELNKVRLSNVPLDGSGGSEDAIKDLIKDGTPVIAEVIIDSNSTCRAWGFLTGDEVTFDQDDEVTTSSLTFKGSRRVAADSDQEVELFTWV